MLKLLKAFRTLTFVNLSRRDPIEPAIFYHPNMMEISSLFPLLALNVSNRDLKIRKYITWDIKIFKSIYLTGIFKLASQHGSKLFFLPRCLKIRKESRYLYIQFRNFLLIYSFLLILSTTSDERFSCPIHLLGLDYPNVIIEIYLFPLLPLISKRLENSKLFNFSLLYSK